MSQPPQLSAIEEIVRTRPIRDLVELHPESMPVLARYGIDLCCGGGHTVPEAARLHDEDGERMVAEVVAALESMSR